MKKINFKNGSEFYATQDMTDKGKECRYMGTTEQIAESTSLCRAIVSEKASGYINYLTHGDPVTPNESFFYLLQSFGIPLSKEYFIYRIEKKKPKVK